MGRVGVAVMGNEASTEGGGGGVVNGIPVPVQEGSSSRPGKSAAASLQRMDSDWTNQPQGEQQPFVTSDRPPPPPPQPGGGGANAELATGAAAAVAETVTADQPIAADTAGGAEGDGED